VAWRAHLAHWRADAMAGLLGATLVLPQAIAFAALAGLPPAMGLAAAVLPTVVAALAGSSRHVLTGPTNATALALGAMLAPLVAGDPALAVPLALLVTLLVGLLQVGLALARLGQLVNFISPSVLLGFTTGAAALIAWYAAGALLGGSGRQAPLQAWAGWALAAAPLWVGGVTLLAAWVFQRVWRRGPHMLLALALGGLASLPAVWAVGAGHLGLPAGSADSLLRLGQTPAAWPRLQWPLPPADQLWRQLPQLLPMALALAIVALGQSMAIAKLMAQRTGQALSANREVLGQGLANLAAGCTGGMVVCGSLNRSLPHLEAGARTRLAGVAAGLLLPPLVALGGPVLAGLPMAAIVGLLLRVAWGLWDRPAWARLWQVDRREFGIASATALACLLLRLEVAVLLGVGLSLVAYLWTSARPALRTMGFDRHDRARPFVVLDDAPPGVLPECPQLKLLRMEGSVWFGAVPHVADRLRSLRSAPGGPRHLLVMAKSMNTLDLAGADLWEDERQRRRASGGDLWFHRPRPQVLALWHQTGFVQRLGEDHLLPDKRRAIATIVPRLDPERCRHCQARVFEECAEQPGAPLSPMI